MSERKIALVTGAGRGIGAATARELGRRGFHVVVNYLRDVASADRVVSEIQRAGGTAEAVAADVTDAWAAAGLVGHCHHIDALVCNANIQPPFAPIADLTWEDFIGKVDAELAAVFYLIKAALPQLGSRAQIVFVSSVASQTVRPGGAAHSTAKAALEAFARAVATEAGENGITVNIVAPAAVRTDSSAAMLTPEILADRSDRSVLGRILEPDDVAVVVAALAAGDLPAVAGARVTIDGGYGLLAPLNASA